MSLIRLCAHASQGSNLSRLKVENMGPRTHVMSRNMRRACVLFLNLRKEKKGIAGTATDLGARSLGIEEEEEQEEVSFGRQQWGMQRNTNCCSGGREGRRGSRLDLLTLGSQIN